MSRTDMIGDVFTIIRNAVSVRKEDTTVPFSNSIRDIVLILKNEGYVENFKEVDLGKLKIIKVYLKYDDKKSVITQIKRVSRPGRRVYRKINDIPSALDGYGVTIVSTSSGLLTGKQAKDKGVGGEIIGMVW